MYYLIDFKKYLILIVFLTVSITTPILGQDKHTILLYTFEDIADGIVKDLSGNGNDGELVGPEWGEGKFRRGMVFGGNEAEDYIMIDDNESLDLDEGITVEMWVKLNSPPTSGGVGVTKARTYKVGPRNNNKAELRMATTENAWGSATLISDGELTVNQWVHIAATYDAASTVAKLYIDGELDIEKEIGGDILPNDEPLWLGRGGNPFLDGTLDEVRISNIARSHHEILMMMEFGVDAVLSVTPKDKLATSWGNIKEHFYPH